MSKHALALPADYTQWLAALKQRINGARQQALLAVNQEHIRLYHDIGREILERQNQQGWGARVIDRLSSDLRAAFPEMRGFSSRNLKYMKVFAEECPELRIGQQAAAQLPWFHIVTLITKLRDPALRERAGFEGLAETVGRDVACDPLATASSHSSRQEIRRGRPCGQPCARDSDCHYKLYRFRALAPSQLE